MTMNLINIFKCEDVLRSGLRKLVFHCEYLISFLFTLISVVIRMGNIFLTKSLAGNKKVTQVLINYKKSTFKNFENILYVYSWLLSDNT